MVSNVKNQKGMTLVELMVAMVILSIGVLAFISTTLTTSRFHQKSNANDYAYALARERLAVLQNGDMPLRWTDSIASYHDGFTYTVIDTIFEDGNTKSARVYVKWVSNSQNREVVLSGYMNRDMCPDVSSSYPSEITFSTVEIPRNAPAAYPLGRVTITDPDSGDQHLLILDPSKGDNKMFRLIHMNVQTAVPCTTAGKYSLVLTASDCDGNELTTTFQLEVPEEDPKPYFVSSSKISVNENEPHGTIITTIKAYPDTVNFQIISQTHPVAVAIDAVTGELTIEDDTLFNYEALPLCSALISVSNGVGADTSIFEIEIENVNETPTAIHLSGALVHVGDLAYTSIGALSSVDPDTGDQIFEYFLTDTSGFFQLALDTIQTSSKSPLVGGFYSIEIESRDPGGLSLTKAISIEIRDTTSVQGSCGANEEWKSSEIYSVGGLTVYWDNYIYDSKNWTQGDEPNPSAPNWNFLGSCDGSAQCNDFSYYNKNNSYDGGDIVYWKKNQTGALDNTVYRAKKWVPSGNSSKPHRSSALQYWEEILGCE